MKRVDKSALRRAIDSMRAEDKPQCQQIDHKLRDEPWQEVGEFAASHCQSRALNLRPWQMPPCLLSLAYLSEPFGGLRGEREGAEMLRRMLDAGLSRFEPDPLRALERVEAARKRTPE